MKNCFAYILLLFSLMAISQTDLDTGKKLYLQGNSLQAQKLFEKILITNPNHLEANEYLGDIFGQNKSQSNFAIDLEYPIQLIGMVFESYGLPLCNF